MSRLKRVDSFDVTFADSFARTALKVDEDFIHTNGDIARKGSGEKRIYVGSDERHLDDFFMTNGKMSVFFTQRQDLEEYYDSAVLELNNPSYKYGVDEKDVRKIFSEYRVKLSALKKERIFFAFNKKYDAQNRYYLVLQPNAENKKNYDYIRDICLPRVSRFLFVKLFDEQNQKFYIYVKPVITKKKEGKVSYALAPEENSSKGALRQKSRDGQSKYKEAVFRKYPYCVVTKVTDPNMLEACHIKGHSFCSEKEKMDPNNGFTMTPTIHVLFDIGYLSFNAQGEMILSDFFRNMDRRLLNLDKTIRIGLSTENKKYLLWHNQNVFIKPNLHAYDF